MSGITCVAFVGVGQMGSRLVQGLLAMPRDSVRPNFQVHIVDPSDQSKQTALARANEIAQGDEIVLHEDCSTLPSELDLAVLSATSHYRFGNLKDLLDQCHPQNLLLEKFLFSKREHYQPALDLSGTLTAPALVHCPRCTWPTYKAIREQVNGDENFHISVTGGAYSLASNCVHFLDLCRFLGGGCVTKVEASEGGLQPAENKRAGYKEVFGKMVGSSEQGNTVTLTCIPAEKPSATVTITTPKFIFEVMETGGEWSATDRQSGVVERNEFAPVFASNNPSVFSDILTGQQTGLPNLREANLTHLAVIDVLMPIIGTPDGVLPIT